MTFESKTPDKSLEVKPKTKKKKKTKSNRPEIFPNFQDHKQSPKSENGQTAMIVVKRGKKIILRGSYMLSNKQLSKLPIFNEPLVGSTLTFSSPGQPPKSMGIKSGHNIDGQNPILDPNADFHIGGYFNLDLTKELTARTPPVTITMSYPKESRITPISTTYPATQKAIKQVTRKKAEEIATNHVMKNYGGQITINKSLTEEHNFGWVFFQVPKKYLKTNDPNDLIPGVGAIVVDRTGKISPLSTSGPPQAQIEELKKRYIQNGK